MTRIAALSLVLIMLAACTAGPVTTGSPSPTAGSPSPTPGSPSPTPAPATPTPATPSPDTGLYLRTSLTQALAPPNTFNWLPMLTISGGRVIDGNVAVPAIYPGPLLILPFEREITAGGQAGVVQEARRLGLLGETTDFTGGHAAPGSQLGHIQLLIDGVGRELIGDPGLAVPCDSANRCNAEPGTPEAFAAFWQQLSYLDGWIARELGPTSTYQPDRLAVLAQPPQTDPGGLTSQVVAWPLDVDFTDFGQPFAGDSEFRCATVSGDDLDILLPVLNESNQLTVFIDSQDGERSLVARVVVPGEASPCDDEGG